MLETAMDITKFDIVPVERRGKRRFSVNHPASIHAGESEDPICCTIVDINEKGARLIAQSPHRVPDRFVLKSIAGELEAEVTIVWRHGIEFAVRFARKG